MLVISPLFVLHFGKSGFERGMVIWYSVAFTFPAKLISLGNRGRLRKVNKIQLDFERRPFDALWVSDGGNLISCVRFEMPSIMKRRTRAPTTCTEERDRRKDTVCTFLSLVGFLYHKFEICHVLLIQVVKCQANTKYIPKSSHHHPNSCPLTPRFFRLFQKETESRN